MLSQSFLQVLEKSKLLGKKALYLMTSLEFVFKCTHWYACEIQKCYYTATILTSISLQPQEKKVRALEGHSMIMSCPFEKENHCQF